MKRETIEDQAIVLPVDLESTDFAAPSRSASDESELARLRQTVERQFRTNQTLVALLNQRTDPKSQSKRVEISPRLHPADWTSRPQRRPANRQRTAFWPDRAVLPVAPFQAPLGYACQSLGETITETVGIWVLGLRGTDLENVVANIADEQRRTKAFRPLFLTDQPDFSPFVSRGYAFEYLPPEKQVAGTGETERLEEVRRYYTAKWGLVRTLDRNNARTRDREYPPLALVINHNAEMSRACHSDRFLWMAETLRIALATERYDAAADLADYLLAWYDRIALSTQINVARSLCRKFVAYGEIEVLQRFLFKNYNRVLADDYLFTLFSVYCTSDKEFVSAMAKLPNGRLNSYYLSKRTRQAGDQIVPTFLAATEATAPNVNFLLANHFAVRRHRDLYRMFVNRGVARVGRAQLRKLSLSEPNVLGTIEFDKLPAARRQTDLVSVIMSSHNSAETVYYAAKSILDQTYRNLELLICDDSPEAGGLEALGALRSDPRVRLFRSNQPQGTYNIRNNLIPLARGALITFQDSDDLAFPDRIENQVDYLRGRDAVGVYGQWYRITKAGEFVFSSEHSVARIAAVSLMAPRAVFESVGPYRSARFGADTEFLEALRLRFGTSAVPNMQVPLLFGLASETSLTRRSGMEATEDGYRSEARRAYASASAKSRLVSWESDDPRAIEEQLAAFDIVVPSAGVTEGIG